MHLHDNGSMMTSASRVLLSLNYPCLLSPYITHQPCTHPSSEAGPPISNQACISISKPIPNPTLACPYPIRPTLNPIPNPRLPAPTRFESYVVGVLPERPPRLIYHSGRYGGYCKPCDSVGHCRSLVSNCGNVYGGIMMPSIPSPCVSAVPKRRSHSFCTHVRTLFAR